MAKSLLQEMQAAGLPTRQGSPAVPVQQGSLLDQMRAQGIKPTYTASQTAAAPAQKRGLLETLSSVAEKGLGAGSSFFNTLGRVGGGLISQGIESAQGLVSGAAPTGQDLMVARLLGANTADITPRVSAPGSAEVARLTQSPARALGNIAMLGLETYPGGGYVGKTVSRIPVIGPAVSKIPGALRESAVGTYQKVLAPTTKEMKAIATKVTPELIQRRVIGSLKSIGSTAASRAEIAGEAVGEAIERVPSKLKIQTKPILEALEKMKSEYQTVTSRGKTIVNEPNAVRAIDQVKDIVTRYGKSASFQDLLQLRRQWDKVIQKSRGFLQDDLANFATAAKRTATNSIRQEFAKAAPDVAKVNREFSFWSDVEKLADATLQRKAGQQTQSLVGRGAKAAAGIGGFMQGGPGFGAAMYTVTNALERLVNSGAWRTVDAVTKNRIASLIERGQIEEVANIMTKLLAPTFRSIYRIANPKE